MTLLLSARSWARDRLVGIAQLNARARTHGNDNVTVGSNLLVKEDETVDEAVTVLGNLEINGHVKGDAVCVLGGVTLGPKAVVDGALIVVFGSVKAAKSAEVKEQLVVIGRKLDAPPDAKIFKAQEVFAPGINLPELQWLADYLKGGLLLARPFPPGLWWVWVVAGVFFLIHLMTSMLFPRPVQACVNALEQRPIASFVSGMLLLVLFAPLILLLVVSVVGILVIPFFLTGVFASLIFGKVAIYRYTGHQFGKQFGAAVLQQPLAALVVGTVLFYLFYMIPFVGLIALKVITILGLGAVLVAIGTGLKRESQPVNGAAAAGTEPPLSVALDDPAALPRAGFWIRFAATLLDLVLIALATLITHLPPLIPILWAAYHIGMWTWKGTTVGGIVAGIKLVRADGRAVDFPTALVRALASLLSALVFFVGFFWAGWSREKRSWHDLIAGTVMVKSPKGMSLI